MGTDKSGRTILLLDFESNSPICLAHTSRLRVQDDLDPVLLQDLGNFFCDVRVLAGQQLGSQTE